MRVAGVERIAAVEPAVFVANHRSNLDVPALFAAAIQTGTPVVPVAIRGTGDVWPARGLAIRPGRTVVSFGEPLPTVGLQRGDLRNLSAAARRSTQELLDQPCP